MVEKKNTMVAAMQFTVQPLTHSTAPADSERACSSGADQLAQFVVVVDDDVVGSCGRGKGGCDGTAHGDGGDCDDVDDRNTRPRPPAFPVFY